MRALFLDIDWLLISGLANLILAAAFLWVGRRLLSANEKTLRETLTRDFEQAKQQEIDEKVSEAVKKATQKLTHDIRSPLTALTMVTEDMARKVSESSKQQLTLLNLAVSRINEIVNQASQSLLKSNTTMKPEPFLISTILTEMRIENPKSDVRFSVDEKAYGVFALAEVEKLRSLLRELFECANQNKISLGLHLTTKSDRVVITIDGFSEDVASESFWNEVKTKTAALGGELSVSNGVASLALKKTSAPSWFAPQISVAKEGHIVIVDDDPSVHESWKRRFSTVAQKYTERLVHFSQAQDVVEWCRSSHLNPNDLFLMDYQLSKDGLDGIQLADSLSIRKQTILVTNKHDDQTVLDRCLALGIRMIPKSISSRLPIT